MGQMDPLLVGLRRLNKQILRFYRKKHQFLVYILLGIGVLWDILGKVVFQMLLFPVGEEL